MKLIDAVQLTGDINLALVGAGGKTTSMFRLGKEWVNRTGTSALLTTTTHLAVKELQGADTHFEVDDQIDLALLLESAPIGVILVTGPLVEEERVGGLSCDALELVHGFARERGVPLLIEADGAAQKPLKAPAEHEPVIPPFVDSVVVVVGMQVLGKQLSDRWVHRAERFSKLTGLPLEAKVEPGSIVAMLLSSDGGLKGIPFGARKMVLFNQCDNDRLASAAKSTAGQLLTGFQRVIYASLREEGSQEVLAANHRVAGLVLAAGGSQRLGQPKQLLDWQGEPFVRVVAKTALRSGLSPVVVVSGAYADGVERALDGLPVEIVNNPRWEEGQSSSMKTGLRVLPPETQAVVMMLVDQPQIPAPLVGSLVEAHAKHLYPIIATMVDQRRGNPVLFDRVTFSDLKKVEGDFGGRKIFSRFQVHYVPWIDPRIGLDVDSMEDYHHLLENWENR
jgi:molybdenum cofactor cytidylyltransferase